MGYILMLILMFTFVNKYLIINKKVTGSFLTVEQTNVPMELFKLRLLTCNKVLVGGASRLGCTVSVERKRREVLPQQPPLQKLMHD